jgi:hypothetical protein
MLRWYILSIGLVALTAGCRPAKHEYPPEVTATFVSHCEIRAPRGACECTLDAIQRRFTYEQFTTLEQQTRDTGKPPAEFQDAARECR